MFRGFRDGFSHSWEATVVGPSFWRFGYRVKVFRRSLVGNRKGPVTFRQNQIVELAGYEKCLVYSKAVWVARRVVHHMNRRDGIPEPIPRIVEIRKSVCR